MGLDALLTSLAAKTVTPVTAVTMPAVTQKTQQTKVCTDVTPVTANKTQSSGEVLITLDAIPAFDREAFAERAAIIEANGIPRAWAEGFATLCTMSYPSAYAPQRWEQLVNDGGLFLDRWGRQAAGLGWRAVDVFGVSPYAPDQRYDGMGLVPLLQGRAIVAITSNTARIDCGRGVAQTFYRNTIAPEAVAVWSLAPNSS